MVNESKLDELVDRTKTYLSLTKEPDAILDVLETLGKNGNLSPREISTVLVDGAGLPPEETVVLMGKSLIRHHIAANGLISEGDIGEVAIHLGIHPEQLIDALVKGGFSPGYIYRTIEVHDTSRTQETSIRRLTLFADKLYALGYTPTEFAGGAMTGHMGHPNFKKIYYLLMEIYGLSEEVALETMLRSDCRSDLKGDLISRVFTREEEPRQIIYFLQIFGQDLLAINLDLLYGNATCNKPKERAEIFRKNTDLSDDTIARVLGTSKNGISPEDYVPGLLAAGIRKEVVFQAAFKYADEDYNRGQVIEEIKKAIPSISDLEIVTSARKASVTFDQIAVAYLKQEEAPNLQVLKDVFREAGCPYADNVFDSHIRREEHFSPGAGKYLGSLPPNLQNLLAKPHQE